jgi:hypothetical protein
MVELVEYVLVVAASTLFVGGSVAVYASFTTLESDLQLKTTFAAVSGLAQLSIEDGTSKMAMAVPGATIACENGSLAVSLGSKGIARSVPVECDFALDVSPGYHDLEFTTTGSHLMLSVS